MRARSFIQLALVLAGALFSLNSAAVVVHNTDFIADGDRENFMDFEHLPSTSGLGNTTSFDGLSIVQVQGDPNDIWTTCGSSCWFNPDGNTWYPSGGDHGYSEISLTSGDDFDSVGFDFGGSRFGLDTLFYELLQDGAQVLFGSAAMPQSSDGYLGFSGGGFDTIRVAAVFDPEVIASFGDGTFQALPLDNIETQSVPAPASALLLLIGLLGAAVKRQR